MRAVTYSAPDELRSRLEGLSISAFVSSAQSLRPSRARDQVLAATKAALSSLAHRVSELEAEIAELDAMIAPLVRSNAPKLVSIRGVGIDTTASLLVAAGDNPERLRSEAAWAHLCGVSPLEASSGKVTRLALDPDTQAYMERRVKEGRSTREVVRVLKRYVAREVFLEPCLADKHPDRDLARHDHCRPTD